MKKKQIGLEQEIAALAVAFAREVASAARMHTLDQLRGAFAKGVGEALDRTAAEALQPARRIVHRKSAHTAPPAKWAKRDPQAIEKLTTRLVSYLAKHPGSNVEQLARGLQCTTKALVLPMSKALARGEITKKGARRGTRYSAA
jgi:hypothetical protein